MAEEAHRPDDERVAEGEDGEAVGGGAAVRRTPGDRWSVRGLRRDRHADRHLRRPGRDRQGAGRPDQPVDGPRDAGPGRVVPALAVVAAHRGGAGAGQRRREPARRRPRRTDRSAGPWPFDARGRCGPGAIRLQRPLEPSGGPGTCSDTRIMEPVASVSLAGAGVSRHRRLADAASRRLSSVNKVMHTHRGQAEEVVAQAIQDQLRSGRRGAERPADRPVRDGDLPDAAAPAATTGLARPRRRLRPGSAGSGRRRRGRVPRSVLDVVSHSAPSGAIGHGTQPPVPPGELGLRLAAAERDGPQPLAAQRGHVQGVAGDGRAGRGRLVGGPGDQRVADTGCRSPLPSTSGQP